MSRNRFHSNGAAAGWVLFVLGMAATVGAEERKSKFNKVVRVGEQAPAWSELIGVDGGKHGLEEYQRAKVLVIAFTCNHCPVARAYEDRLIEFSKKHREEGVQVVAINVNRIEADRLDKMQARAKEKSYPFPYLFDESQRSARSYGATVTPHFFVLDQERRIAYMGAFDDDLDSAQVKERFVPAAVEALLAGKAPEVKETLQRGCGILYE